MHLCHFAQTFKSYLSREEGNKSRREKEKDTQVWRRELTKNQNDRLLLTTNCSEEAVSYSSDNSVHGPTHSHNTQAAAVTQPSIPSWSRRCKGHQGGLYHAHIQMCGKFHIHCISKQFIKYRQTHFFQGHTQVL